VQGKGSGGRYLEGKQVGFKGRFERGQGWQLTEGEGKFVPGYWGSNRKGAWAVSSQFCSGNTKGERIRG
jgi:hypothetical protein